jgi:hypothetical protein
VTIERIVALYKQLLEIRKLHGELEKAGVPAQNLKGVEEHANAFMEKGIEAASKEILDSYDGKGDKHRRNELEVELRTSMNQLAKRIDRGFNISVRASEEAGEADGNENDQNAAKHMAVVKANEQAIQYLRVGGTPILSLPGSDDGKKGRK